MQALRCLMCSPLRKVWTRLILQIGFALYRPNGKRPRYPVVPIQVRGLDLPRPLAENGMIVQPGLCSPGIRRLQWSWDRALGRLGFWLGTLELVLTLGEPLPGDWGSLQPGGSDPDDESVYPAHVQITSAEMVIAEEATNEWRAFGHTLALEFFREYLRTHPLGEC